MSVTWVCIGFLSVSGSATFGYFLAALLASRKVTDLERAYFTLSQAIRAFLGECPNCAAGFLALDESDLGGLQAALVEADSLAGWTIEDLRR